MNTSNPSAELIVIGGPVDSGSVCLTIRGEDLDPAEVTKVVGVNPTSSHKRGDPRTRGPPRRDGAWILEDSCVEPDDPGALLLRLLSQFTIGATVWGELRTRYEVRIWIGVHICDFNRGFELSAETIRLVGLIGAPLLFDIYAYEADEE